jgi:hypothetical protein
MYKNEPEMLFLIMSPLEHGAAKWKTGLRVKVTIYDETLILSK